MHLVSLNGWNMADIASTLLRTDGWEENVLRSTHFSNEMTRTGLCVCLYAPHHIYIQRHTHRVVEVKGSFFVLLFVIVSD